MLQKLNSRLKNGDNLAVRYALGAIRNVGVDAMRELVENRSLKVLLPI